MNYAVTATVGIPGPQGPEGPPGTQGPPGTPGFPDAPNDGRHYVRQSGQWVVFHPRSDTYEFNWSNNTDVANTGNDQIRANSATPASVTQLGVSNTTATGQDMTNLFAHISPGVKVYLQDKDDSARWQEYTLVSRAPGDGCDLWTADHLNGQGAPFSNNQRLLLVLYA